MDFSGAAILMDTFETTAVRLLLGLISSDSGSIRVLVRNSRDSDARTNLGVTLQGSRVPDKLCVSEHIDLVRSYYSPLVPAAEGTRSATCR